MSFRKLLRQWFSSARRPLANKRPSSTARAKRWLQLERLEDRLVPATVSDLEPFLGGTISSTTLTFTLAPSENLSIASYGSYYMFSSNLGFTNGGVASASDFSGFNTGFLNLNMSGISLYTTGIDITDTSGTSSSPNDTVTFDDNGATIDYTNSFDITLSNAAAGPSITFIGTSTFSGNNTLTAITNSAIDFQGGASVPYQGTVMFGVQPGGGQTITMANGPGWAALGFTEFENISVTNPNGTVSSYYIDSLSGNSLTVELLSGPGLTSGTDPNVTVAVNSAHVSASSVNLTAGNSLAVQSTGVPYMGGLTIHAGPPLTSGQPFAGEPYITGPDWGSYGYQPGDTITLTNATGVTSTTKYTVANIVGDNLYLISSQTFATSALGTDPDVTVACANFTPEIIASKTLDLSATGDVSTISGAIETPNLDDITANGNITLQDTEPVSVALVDAGTAQIQLDVAGAIVPVTGKSFPELIAGSVDLTTTGPNSYIGTSPTGQGGTIRTFTGELTAATNDGGINIDNQSTTPLTINSIVADQDGQAPTVNDGQIVYNNNPGQSPPTYASGSSNVSIFSNGPVVLNSISATGSVGITGESIVEGNAQSKDIVAPGVNLTATGTANYQGQVTFANNAGGDTLTLPNTGPTWTSLGFTPNDVIIVSGASAKANDAAFTVASISPDGYTLTLTTSYVVEPETEPDVKVGDGMIGLASAPPSASAGTSPSTASAAIALSEVGEFDAFTTNGNIYVALGAAVDCTASGVIANGTGNVSVTSAANFLSVYEIEATGATPTGGNAVLGGNITLDVSNGSLLQYAPGIIQGQTVSLTSGYNIGSPSSPIMTDAASGLGVAASATSPSSAAVYVDNTSNLTSVGASTYDGNVLISYNGSNGSYAGQLKFSNNVLSESGSAVVTFANTDDNDGSADNVVLSGAIDVAGITAGGQILAQNLNTEVSGQFIMLSAGDGIGVPGTSTATSGASIATNLAGVDATTNTGGIYIQNNNQFALPIPPGQVTFAPNPQGAGDTMTLPSLGRTWKEAGFAPGDVLVVSGATAAANNGTFIIASISKDGFTVTLTVSGVLQAEQDAHVTVLGALPVSASTSNGNIDVGCEFDMILGNISTNANGTVTLSAGDTIYNPNIVNATSATVSGGTLVLTANGVGTPSNPLETSVTSLAAALSDFLFLDNDSSLTVTSSNIAGSVSISAMGNLTLQGPAQFQAGLFGDGSVSLTATGGALTTTGAVSLDEPSVTISAEQIGSPTDVIQTGAATINATATYGGIYISNDAEGTLTLTAAAVGPQPGGVATNNIAVYNAGSIIIDPQTGSLVGSQPVGLYNPGAALALYAGVTVSADGLTTTAGMSGTTITSSETPSTPGAYYDVFTGAKPTIMALGNSSGVSPSLQILTGQSEPLVNQPGGGGSPPVLITEAELANGGPFPVGSATITGSSITIMGSSIIIDDDLDSNGQAPVIQVYGSRSLTLTATGGPIVFLNPEDTLAVANDGTITINAEGSNGEAVLGNLTAIGGAIAVTAVGNIIVGSVNAGSGQVALTSNSGAVLSSNGTTLAISADSTIVKGAGQPASASQSASLAELNATRAIATADAAGAQAAAEQTTANAFNSELTSINSQLTSLGRAVSNDQLNYQADEQVVTSDNNTVNADMALVNRETIASNALSVASTAASIVASFNMQIATGLLEAGSVLSGIPFPVGYYLAVGTNVAAYIILESSNFFTALGDAESLAGNALAFQMYNDSQKMTDDSNKLATAESNAAQVAGQSQADLDAQTGLTDEYDATLVAYDIAQLAATNDQMIAMQDQAVSGQAIAAVANTATPPSLSNVNGSLTIANQANVLIPAGATIQAGLTSMITITGDTNDNPKGATVTVAGTLSAASALIDVGPGSTGPDTFNITPSATTPITVTGGAGTDTLNFNADGLAVTIVGNTITAASMKPVTFSNIADVNIIDAANGGASYTLAGTSGQSNALRLVGTAQGAGTVTLNGVALSFSGVTSFNYEGGSGDTISVTPFTTSGLPWNVAVTVAGASGSPASLTYNSVASLADTVTLTGADAGTIGSPGLTSVQFSNVGTITTNASQSPGDQLTVNLPGTTAKGVVNTLDAQQTAAGTAAFTLNAFSEPFSLTSNGYGTVNLSDTMGTALFEVGVGAALETNPTASVNFDVVGSPVYNDHLLVQDEGGEPAGSHDVITPSAITGNGSVTVGALNPVTYEDVQSVKLLPTVTVADAGGTYNGKPFAATAQVNGGASLNGVKPTLTYYSYSGAFTPTVNNYTGTFTPPAGAVKLSGAPAKAGTYAVVASFAGAGTYASNWAWTTFTISQVNHQVSGNAITNPVGLTVRSAPAITASPVSLTINAGRTATFTAAASALPAPTVQWQRSTDGGRTFVTITGATSRTLTFTAGASQNGYEYRALFANSLGRVTSDPAILTVNSAPLITASPANQTVTLGTAVSFTAEASGNPSITTVQWQVSTDGGSTFSNIEGATSLTLSFTPTRSDSGKRFRSVFVNALGRTATRSALLTVVA